VHNVGVVPFFFHARNPERTFDAVPLLLSFAREETGGQNAWQWTLLYFHKHDRETSLTNAVPALLVVQEGRSREVGGLPAVLARRRREENRSWTLARAAAFWSDRGRGARAGSSPPGTRATRRAVRVAQLLPLFYQASGPDHFSLLTLFGGYRRSGPSRLWYATPLVLVDRHVPTSSFSMVFPLWFRHTDKCAERPRRSSRAGALRVAHDARDALPTALAVSGTTATSRRRPGGAAAVLRRPRVPAEPHDRVVPAVRQAHIAAEERPTGCRRSSTATRRPTYGTTFGFPLVFVPLYWDIKRGDDETTLVLPLF
jgi:hypothetical protein